MDRRQFLPTDWLTFISKDLAMNDIELVAGRMVDDAHQGYYRQNVEEKDNEDAKKNVVTF